MLAPASTNEPTSGKATNAGIRVTLPASADIIVTSGDFDDPRKAFIVSGGINVSTNPIKKIMPNISPIIFFIILLDFFIAIIVFFLSLVIDITNNIIDIAQN